MREESIEQKIKAIRRQVQSLTQRAGSALDLEHMPLANALEELSAALEELEVADEDLCRQNQELAAVRLALEISETRYRRLFETAQDGILIIDFDTEQISDVNPFLTEMLGYSPEDVVGKKIWEMGAFTDVKASKAAFEELLKKGYVRYENLPLQTKEGRLLAMEFVSNVYTVDHKKVIQCNIRDITARKRAEESLKGIHEELERRIEARTSELVEANKQMRQQIEERKQAEEALRESETKYRIVADNTYDWEWWRDPDGKFVYVSPSCKEATHHSGGEFAADPDLLLKIIHPDDKPAFIDHMNELEEKHSPGEAEFRILRPDGTIRWIAHACQPVFDDQGRFHGRRGSNRDITKRKEAETALKESEERYRTILETMNEGFGVVDERGVWTYVNERLCNMLGYSCDEIVGQPVHGWLDEANRKILSDQLNKRRKGKQETYEIAGIRKDGSKIYTLVSPKPIFGEAGQFQGSFAVITDITERKKAEESLRSALSEIKSLKDRLEAENIYFRQESEMRHEFRHIIGQSNAFKYVLYRAEQVAAKNTTVLILGETGTGKELIAAAIHQMSPRRDRALITVNCAALPANLIESELFGREKGAFTGADSRQVGRFEVANGSTLCLDEIGELPMEAQAKLLRVIQHGEFERLGSSRTIKVDVRIVATTNRNLEQEVRKGLFRQDLYYRLNVFPLTVPPLRQRKDDMPLLVNAFISRYARELGKEFTSIQNETLKALQDYDWPGNVRELGNVIERAAILCPGPVFQLADKLQSSPLSLTTGLRTLEETERDQILKTLAETRWHINGPKGAAAILGLHPSTLRARMQKLGIRRPEIKTPA